MSPLVRAVVALTAGSVAGGSVGVAPETAVRLAMLGAACLVVSARLGWGGHARIAGWSAPIGACVLGASLAVLADDRAWSPPNLDLDALAGATTHGEAIALSGVVRRDAWLSDSGSPQLDLRVDRVLWHGRWRATDVGVRVTIAGGTAVALRDTWTRGRRVEAPVSSWRRPLPYRNFGTPDAERQLARRGIRAFATIKSAALVQTQPAPWWEERAALARRTIRTSVARHVPDPIAAATVTAILIGDRSRLPDRLVRDLQHAGVYHVVAISGGNVGIWLALIVWLPRLAGSAVRVAAVWLAIGLAGFALIVDGGASVARAVSVAAVVIAARWWDVRASAPQALAAAAAVQVLTDPLAVHDPGCVLSFGAAGTLVFVSRLLAQPRVRPPNAPLPAWVRPIAALGVVVGSTLAIELVLLPITARWFHVATAAGLLANLLAVPAMAVVQVAGLALLAAAPASALVGAATGAVAAIGVGVLLRSADIVAMAPWLVREVPAPSGVVLGSYYIALAGLAFCVAQARISRGRSGASAARAFAKAALMCACAVTAGLAWIGSGGAEHSRPSPWTWQAAERWQRASWPREPWLLVTILDVGQGDATVIRFPSGRTWLIDAGGGVSEAFDTGARVTVPALWALGHRRLDRVFVTHGHPDHAAGMPAVIRRFAPRELLTGIPVEGDRLEAQVIAAAAAVGSRQRRLAAGESLTDGGVRVSVRHPESPDWDRPRVRNDDSVVLWLRLGDVGLLLPGDVGADIERDVAARVEPAPITLVKLAHHGSASSTTPALIETVRPAIAIASAGRGNRFGHPAASVLQRLAAAGITVLRTDRDGAIQIATNGRVVLVRTATGRAMSLPSRP